MEKNCPMKSSNAIMPTAEESNSSAAFGFWYLESQRYHAFLLLLMELWVESETKT
jgi:hypothetical protein